MIDHNQIKVKDSVALVTGGTKGIGFAIAKALISSGYAVFICGRGHEDVQKAVAELSQSGKAAGKVCDVRDEDQVRAMLDSCVRNLGGIDVLINNAGMAVPGKAVEELSGDEFRQTLETNLFGVFYACHHALPMIKKRGGGYIIRVL